MVGKVLHEYWRNACVVAAVGLAGCASVPLSGTDELAVAPSDWPIIGREPGATRFSPLTQIDVTNVGGLKPAWIYNMRPTGAGAGPPTKLEREQARAEQGGAPAAGAQAQVAAPQTENRRFVATQSIPLVVNGTMYLATPYSRVVALDAATGETRWVHEIGDGINPATRGMAYWPGNATAPPALVFGTSDGKLRSLRASDGTPSPLFGAQGAVDLRTPDVMVGGMGKAYGMSSPPVIYKNIIITGSAVGEQIGGSRGDVRAWDAVTGERLWTFKSVPDPGEPGSETWGGNSGVNRSGVNVWGLMTVDADRGIVYMPFGAPSSDRIGVDRPGDNLYGSSVVAADATTGKYLWHFQVVHHDIWDNDTQAPPILFDVERDGRKVPAVGIVSKNGLLFILDRVTGQPLFDVVERPVPPSDVPGEIASRTQPFPVRPEPLTRMSFSADQVSKVTPEHEAFCRNLIQKNNLAFGGPYNPPSFQRPGVYFPGTLGGVNWSGAAFDPVLDLIVVNVFQLGQIMQIVPDGSGFFANRGPINGRFWDPSTRLPCQEGPWGELIAVDPDTGEIAWRVPHGISENLPAGKQLTGRPSIGGPITTAGGLTFVAGTDDRRFRAFDTQTGRMIWEYKLPASAHTNPITYSAGGKQYVAIVSTGGSFLGSPVESDQLTVFAVE